MQTEDYSKVQNEVLILHFGKADWAAAANGAKACVAIERPTVLIIDRWYQ